MRLRCCVVVVDVLGQLSMWQARLVGPAAWRFGPTHACQGVGCRSAGTVMLVSRVMGGDRVGGRWGGAYALL